MSIDGRLGGAEHVRELAQAVVGQQRVDDRAEREHGDRRDDRLVAVGELHADHVAGADAEGRQPGRGRGRVAGEAAVVVGAALVDHGDSSRARSSVVRDPLGQRGVVPPTGCEVAIASFRRGDDVVERDPHGYAPNL